MLGRDRYVFQLKDFSIDINTSGWPLLSLLLNIATQTFEFGIAAAVGDLRCTRRTHLAVINANLDVKIARVVISSSDPLGVYAALGL